MLYINKKVLWVMSLVFIIIIGSIVFKLVSMPKSIQTNALPSGYIAIVIDDLGGNGEGTDELMKLDIPITAAVMPFLGDTGKDVEKCCNAGLEVILHLSMEPESGSPSWLGPRPITTNNSNEEIRKIVEDGLKEVKCAKGMNNHMGSKAMKDNRIMTEVLKVAKEKDMFFLDSLTGEYSVAEEIAQELGVVYFGRDLFLDNSKNISDIEKVMDKLGDIALKRGYAIGIGHIGGQGGKNTIAVIDKKSKELKERGVEFIYLSQIVNIIKDN